MKTKILIAVGMAVLVVGCASPDKAIFVTSTSLSLLEGDTKPAGMSVAYKRVEGYLGPNNADGTAPPVIASIQSDGKLWGPKIRQLYATGAAAKSASSGDVCKPNKTANGKDRELMFFGTSTNVGLSVGTTSSVPDSFAFGYKRKEFSLIPLVKIDSTENYVYPSVLASIDTTGELGDSTSNVDVALSTNQLFATGEAACELAKELHQEFVDRVRLSVDDQQRVMAARALNCYAGVRLRDRVAVWRDANFNDLYHEDEDERGAALFTLEGAYAESVSGGAITDADKLFRADKAYTASVFITSPGNSERLARLTEHRGFVCGLSRSNTPN